MTQGDVPIPPAAAALACPHCAKAVAFGPDDVGQAIACPHCQQQFTIPAFAAGLAAVVPPANGKEHALTPPADEQTAEQTGDGFFVVDDTGERAQLVAHKRDELNSMHIRSVSHLRRAAIRSRSYMIIGGIACVAGAIQLVWWVGDFVRVQHRFGTVQGLYVVGALGLLRLAHVCYKRAEDHKREFEKTDIDEPTTPPDFTPLNDGSQCAKDLDKM